MTEVAVDLSESESSCDMAPAVGGPVTETSADCKGPAVGGQEVVKKETETSSESESSDSQSESQPGLEQQGGQVSAVGDIWSCINDWREMMPAISDIVVEMNAADPAVFLPKLKWAFEHYNWVMKHEMKSNTAEWGKLLADVPRAPGFGRPLAAEPGTEVVKLLSKYSWQFRRPSRWSDAARWESHTTVSQSKDGGIARFFDDEWLIPHGDMQASPLWGNLVVDWDKWGWRPSGLVLPLRSAVGDRMVVIRKVRGISLAGMLFLLGKDFTAAELEELANQLWC